MSEWQPIETAPKDGSLVLVYGPHNYGSVRVARWVRREQYHWVKDGPDAMRRVPSGESSEWVVQQLGWDSAIQYADEEDETGPVFIPPYEPTHWLPMPPPPDA